MKSCQVIFGRYSRENKGQMRSNKDEWNLKVAIFSTENSRKMIRILFFLYKAKL